jgi:orotidine-5'-phosphate decarboxylase
LTEIKTLLEESFLTVTPGIKTKPMDGNQTRFTTPKEALNNGSKFLVIGRPITASENPLKSLEKIIEDINL